MAFGLQKPSAGMLVVRTGGDLTGALHALRAPVFDITPSPTPPSSLAVAKSRIV